MEVIIVEGGDIGELQEQMNLVLKKISPEEIFDIKINTSSSQNCSIYFATIILK